MTKRKALVNRVQNETCRSAYLLTHVGKEGATPNQRAVLDVFNPLIIACPNCAESYDYSDSEQPFRQKELSLWPPAEYLDRSAAGGIPLTRGKTDRRVFAKLNAGT
jgi:hypothetical protein